MGSEWEDLGFRFDWLIVDVKPREQRTWSPMNWQLCDPSRPTTIVSGGPGRRRWEFMRLPGETIAELNTRRRAWQLLEPWNRTPENTTIERHAVYTFEAKWTREWRCGRLMIAGDAVHLMPPFAGQGMCAGMRDIANLVWKLDLVMRDVAAEGLLDSYGTERSANVQHFIHLSMALGQVICVLDEDTAAERDRRMVAGGAERTRVLPAGPPPRLGPGVLSDQPVAGLSMPQGRVRRDGHKVLLDT
jgi:2-polyprenyl-6-methoxyphenol hydroxylase-like FAD-dependent oxidoreductase